MKSCWTGEQTMTCPYCHAVERLGVRLTPLKATIFDRIKRAGDFGVSSTELVGELYDNRVAANTIKAHVWQINQLLTETTHIIRSDGRVWFLRRRGRGS
jgi:hypothetical protein